jgi:plastocyanin
MLVAAGCSGGDEAGGSAGAGSVAASASFDVSLTEFSISPEMIHAPAGQDLTFSVTNDRTTQHTVAINTGGELIETPELQPGETQALEVPALDGGDHAPVDRRDEAARDEHELQSAPPLRLRPAPRHGDKEQVRPLMTLILAIRCADGLVLASDGQSTV